MKLLDRYATILIVIAVVIILLWAAAGCAPRQPSAYQIAVDNYRGCLHMSADSCERQRQAFLFERDQAQVRQMDSVSAAAQQQQLLNSMAIYRAYSSPCGIGTPCR